MIGSDKYQRNFHETLDEAIEDVNRYLRPRSDYEVWVTDEGLFQWVAQVNHPVAPEGWDVRFIGRTRDLRPDWKARREMRSDAPSSTTAAAPLSEPEDSVRP